MRGRSSRSCRPRRAGHRPRSWRPHGPFLAPGSWQRPGGRPVVPLWPTGCVAGRGAQQGGAAPEAMVPVAHHVAAPDGASPVSAADADAAADAAAVAPGPTAEEGAGVRQRPYPVVLNSRQPGAVEPQATQRERAEPEMADSGTTEPVEGEPETADSGTVVPEIAGSEAADPGRQDPGRGSPWLGNPFRRHKPIQSVPRRRWMFPTSELPRSRRHPTPPCLPAMQAI